jgi:hypothetical protein
MPSDITPDDIAGAILYMLNVLHLLNGMDGYDPGDGRPVMHVPFADNVTEAVERFDRPELRSELVRLLYAEQQT